MIEALMGPISEVLDAVRLVIERTPPELIGDIMKGGIVMTGGGSKIPGLAKMIYEVTGIKTRLADDAVSCVAKGTGIAIDNPDVGPAEMLRIAKERKNNKQ